jgi:hypothetical protein
MRTLVYISGVGVGEGAGVSENGTRFVWYIGVARVVLAREDGRRLREDMLILTYYAGKRELE